MIICTKVEQNPHKINHHLIEIFFTISCYRNWLFIKLREKIMFVFNSSKIKFLPTKLSGIFLDAENMSSKKGIFECLNHVIS